MTTATISDRDAFLRAIVAESDEDTPRLAFADWLDEHGDAANRDRAEFIRIQIRRAQLPPCTGEPTCATKNRGVSVDRQFWCADCFHGELIGVRERELLAANGAVWRKGPVCEKCGGKTILPEPCPDCVHWKGYVPKDCACGGTRRKKCPACEGTGDGGGLMSFERYEKARDLHPRKRWAHKVEWSRGFPSEVNCAFQECIERVTYRPDGCTFDVTGWQLSAWARAVARHHPVRRFVPTDKRASHGGQSTGRYHGWWRDVLFGTHDDELDLLPSFIWDALPCDRSPVSDWKLFDTPEAAITALATTVCQLARRTPPAGG